MKLSCPLMSVCTIRPALPSDAERIVEFQISMAKESEDLMLDKSTVAQGVQAVFVDRSRGSYYVAEQDETVVGCLLTIPEWSDWRNGTVLWIHSLYVVPHARQQGVFRRFYAYLQDHVEQTSDLKGLRLYVNRSNLRAQKAYERMGMNRERYFLYEWMQEF